MSSTEFDSVQHGGLMSAIPPSTWLDTATPSTSKGSSGFDSLEQKDPSTALVEPGSSPSNPYSEF
jgi:hypothetical protein